VPACGRDRPLSGQSSERCRANRRPAELAWLRRPGPGRIGRCPDSRRSGCAAQRVIERWRAARVPPTGAPSAVRAAWRLDRPLDRVARPCRASMDGSRSPDDPLGGSSRAGQRGEARRTRRVRGRRPSPSRLPGARRSRVIA
jgi:hypothetical protein